MNPTISPVVRFAPSPTGLLHVGNLRTAIYNWLTARRQGGTFMLRLDDTDTERSNEAFAEAIRTDLKWLGLVWAIEERQSARTARYEAVAEDLKARGLLYPCYESEDELERRRARQRARGLPPIYDRAALKLAEEERARLQAEGRRPHWRFRLPNTESPESLMPAPTLISWNDAIRGDQTVDLGSLSDPVLMRADGSALYTFTSVVDDVDFAITHVIRGEDHVTNTGVQIALFEAIGAVPPVFAHHSLLVGRDGEPLSKRLGALSIASLREAGIEPMALASHAALVGTSENVGAHQSLDELAALFDLAKVSRAPARFDPVDLAAVNAALLHATPHEAVSARLAAAGIEGGRDFWEAVRGNLATFADVAGWWDVVGGDIAPVIENAELTCAAAELLPAEPWDAATWSAWTKAVTATTGAKGKALFHPLRLALTGRDTGPELRALLPLIGRARALRRLGGAAGV